MPQASASMHTLPPHANVSTSTTRRTLFQPTLSRRPASSTSNHSLASSTTTSRPATATSRPTSRASRAKQHPVSSTDQTEIVPRDAMGRYAIPALMTTTLPSPEGEEDVVGMEEREREEKARIENARAHMLNARWRGYGGWDGPDMEEVTAMVWERLRESVRKAENETWMFGPEEGEARGGGAFGVGEEG